MEKTTIYLDDELKMHLLEKAAELSKIRGKRVAMTDIIREAVREYAAKGGATDAERKRVLKRMLATRGAMSAGFEKRVRKAREAFEKWEIRSA